MDIGPIKRIVKVEPEPFPLGHPENAPEEPHVVPEPELIPVGLP